MPSLTTQQKQLFLLLVVLVVLVSHCRLVTVVVAQEEERLVLGLGEADPVLLCPSFPKTTRRTHRVQAEQAARTVQSSSSALQQRETETVAAIRQRRWLRRRESWFVCLLAASAGWADVRAHRRYGCFVNMCTGNTIRATLALLETHPLERQKAILPWTVVAGYCGGVAMARNVQNKLKQQDFQHDQQVSSSNNNNNKNNKNTCLAIIPVTVILFTLTDLLLYFYNKCRTVVTVISTTTNAPSAAAAAFVWHTLSALPQAVAYGLMHETASQATGGTIFFAVTGHWASLARLSTDQAWLIPQHDNDDKKQQQQQQQERLLRHCSMVASFVLGILAAVLCLDGLGPLLPGKLVLWTHSVSYTLTGIAYASLFYWYGNGNGGGDRNAEVAWSP